MALPLASGLLRAAVAAPVAGNAIRLTGGLLAGDAAAGAAAGTAARLAPLVVPTAATTAPVVAAGTLLLGAFLGGYLIGGLLASLFDLANRSQRQTSLYPAGTQQPTGTYNPVGLTIYTVSGSASTINGETCQANPPSNFGPRQYGAMGGEFVWLRTVAMNAGGNCTNVTASSPLEVRLGSAPGVLAGSQVLDFLTLGPTLNLTVSFTSQGFQGRADAWPSGFEGDPGDRTGLVGLLGTPASPPQLPKAPPAAPPATPAPPQPPGQRPPGDGRPLLPPIPLPLPIPSPPQDPQRPRPRPRQDGAPAEVGQLQQPQGPSLAPRVPQFPTQDPQRQTQQTTGSGQLQQVPAPAPRPTPTDLVQYGPETVGDVAARPRPDLVGISSELGRIEQKVAALLRRDPAGGFDLAKLLEELEKVLKSILDDKPAGQYELFPACPGSSGDGPPEPIVIEWTASTDPIEDLAKRIDSIAMLIQAHKDLGQPTCTTPIVGRPVTVLFESDPL